MKTVLIYDQCGEDSISYIVLSGDYSRFDQVYINTEDPKADELSELLYDEEGNLKVKLRKKFPYKAVNAGAKVYVCGLIP